MSPNLSQFGILNLLFTCDDTRGVSKKKCHLKMYPKYSKKTFDNMVTGDETWVYYFEPKRKVANRIWANKNARRPSIAKRILRVKKVLYAIFSLIRVQLFKSRCQKAERSQASSIKTYVVGTQKNRHYKTVLLSTKNIMLKLWVRNIYNFKADYFCLSKPIALNFSLHLTLQSSYRLVKSNFWTFP